jgi:hypothetical protein
MVKYLADCRQGARMNLASLELLHTSAGEAALAEAMALAPDDASFLTCFGRLEKRYPPELARAALQTAILRQRARAKFTLADRMFFVREALEQASSEVVARHRARRFAGLDVVGDFCCGIGGDAIALADRGPIIAVDCDPLRLAMAGHNLHAYGLRERALLIEGDVLRIDLPCLDGLFVDPDRRSAGRRHLSIDACRPALDALRARLPGDPPLAVKLAPGVSWAELARYNGEAEFVSLDGELKECVLWLGPLRGPARRATLLPGGDSLSADTPAPAPPPSLPGTYLYEPDPAVLRAGLVSDLALRLDAAPLDPNIAYLTADRTIDTRFARCFVIEAAMPFHLRRLQEYLRQRGVGRVMVSRRGSPIEPDELIRKLKLTGSEVRTVVLTQVQGRPYALVVRPVSSSPLPSGERGRG